ncbi:MAG: divergent PAP2 family protein [Patescibacteria group bacterium]
MIEQHVYLVAAAVAWLTAQLLKYVFGSLKNGRWFDSSVVLHSGNMPSVHTATVVSLATIVALKDGTDSGLFALAFLFAAVVAYDAMGVRRSSGEQGQSIREAIKNKSIKARIPYVALGHTKLEVAVGAILGLAVGIFVAFFTSTINL